jgi:hypothetical protein
MMPKAEAVALTAYRVVYADVVAHLEGRTSDELRAITLQILAITGALARHAPAADVVLAFDAAIPSGAPERYGAVEQLAQDAGALAGREWEATTRPEDAARIAEIKQDLASLNAAHLPDGISSAQVLVAGLLQEALGLGDTAAVSVFAGAAGRYLLPVLGLDRTPLRAVWGRWLFDELVTRADAAGRD